MTFLEKNYPLDDYNTVLLLEELSLWSAHFGRMLLDHVPLRKGLLVLDVGCGAGFPLFELANRLDSTCKLTGIDPWGAGAKRAKWKNAHHQLLATVEVVECDAAQMPFPAMSFDLVTSNLGINNFDDPATVLKECHRVLRRDGKLCLTTNTEGHFMEFYSVFETVLKELGLDDVLPKVKAHEQHRGNDETIRDLLEAANFSVVKIVRDKFHMRFLSGTALLNHFLIVIGFLPAWRELIPTEFERRFFTLLERKLNEQSDWDGELKLTVPMLYVEAIR